MVDIIPVGVECLIISCAHRLVEDAVRGASTLSLILTQIMASPHKTHFILILFPIETKLVTVHIILGPLLHHLAHQDPPLVSIKHPTRIGCSNIL